MVWETTEIASSIIRSLNKCSETKKKDTRHPYGHFVWSIFERNFRRLGFELLPNIWSERSQGEIDRCKVCALFSLIFGREMIEVVSDNTLHTLAIFIWRLRLRNFAYFQRPHWNMLLLFDVFSFYVFVKRLLVQSKTRECKVTHRRVNVLRRIVSENVFVHCIPIYNGFCFHTCWFQIQTSIEPYQSNYRLVWQMKKRFFPRLSSCASNHFWMWSFLCVCAPNNVFRLFGDSTFFLFFF